MGSVRLILFTLLVISAQWSGAEQPVNYIELLNHLEKEAFNGNKRALRDIGTLLANKAVKKQAVDILKGCSLFLDKEIVIDIKLSKEQFLDFYYTHEKQIQYSDIYNAYYLTPIENWPEKKVVVKLRKESNKDISQRLSKLLNELKIVYNEGELNAVEQITKSIAALQIKEGYEAILSYLQKKGTSQKLKKSLDKIFCQYLIDYSNEKTIQALLDKVKKKELSEGFVAPLLSKLINLKMPTTNLVATYHHYLDSLGSLSAIHSFGYEKNFAFQPSFFDSDVDYYGRILTLCLDKPWLEHNAIKDLLQLKHPRALFYIASFYYKNRKRVAQKKPRFCREHIVETFEQICNAKIETANISCPSNEEALVQLLYWAKNYPFYEWSENQKLFVNKKLLEQKTENYERLFRRLTSRNDSVAIKSFTALTEGNPEKILELTDKYRQLLRSHNKAIPSFKYHFLEMLTLLTDFCKKNDFDYKVHGDLKKLLLQLENVRTNKERYALENQIIESLDLDDITAVEYWMSIHKKNVAMAFSIGRILDWVYSKNWSSIISNKDQLRLYLKKSQLFSAFGVYGTCNSYLNKFQDIIQDQSFQTYLKNLLHTETDPDIKNQLDQLIVQQKENISSKGFDLQSFIEQASTLSRKEIRLLPNPAHTTDYQKIISAIKNQKDLSAIKNLFDYLSFHANIDAVPALFELIDDQRILIKNENTTLKISDRLVPIFENIYNYSFSNKENTNTFNTASWRKLWQQDKNNYKNWAKKFYSQKLKQSLAAEKLKIELINDLVASPNFDSIYIKTILGALPKLSPQKDIRKLKLPYKLSVKDHLSYFKNFHFNYKVLDDIPKLFKAEQANQLLDFIENKSETYDLEQKGNLYNNILSKTWLSDFILQGKISEQHAAKIKSILKSYLNESDFISEFEEKRTVINIATINALNKSLEEKLLASLQIDADDASIMEYQENLIAQIDYKDIGLILQHIDKLNFNNGKSPYAFLSRDFGIPIFDLDHYKKRKTFVKDYEKLSEHQLYLKYLLAFGLDFLDKKGNLDFNKIYHILQYDIVSPFVGNGGAKRDWYTFGIIKLLEYKFDTRLGFPKKLNLSKNYYSNNVFKRAKAWMEYLQKNKKLNSNSLLPPSFNILLADE